MSAFAPGSVVIISNTCPDWSSSNAFLVFSTGRGQLSPEASKVLSGVIVAIFTPPTKSFAIIIILIHQLGRVIRIF
jgi:hypothetical protein